MFLGAGQQVPEGEEDIWLTREQVAERCPSCAERMVEKGIIRIRANLLFNERLKRTVLFGEGSDCEGCP